VKAVVEFTAETFGSLDILVNSAGVWSYAHIYDMPEEEFVRVINVNLNGSFRVAKHVSDYMVKNGIQGKMVFISSDCYTMPFPVFGGYSHYAASKGGIVALTTELAKELKRFGIVVNTVAPGPMSTPGGIYNQVARSLPDEKKAEFGAEMTVNQVDVNPDTDAVALAVYMMCTNLADGINGDCVLADKGMTHNCLYRQPAIKEFPPKAE
jgi:NAD(P)-dependent dehydrogenase (short-subunit alcohol dehydrogenase family)